MGPQMPNVLSVDRTSHFRLPSRIPFAMNGSFEGVPIIDIAIELVPTWKMPWTRVSLLTIGVLVLFSSLQSFDES
jgi:hypothetical protein